VSLWSANAGTTALFDALNIVYGRARETRLGQAIRRSLAFTLGTIALVLLAVMAMIVLPIALDYLGLATATASIVSVGRWPFLLIGVALAIAIIYRYAPSREEAKWQWISWGSTFCDDRWLSASILFSWYAQNFGNYNKTYGSLGAAIGLHDVDSGCRPSSFWSARNSTPRRSTKPPATRQPDPPNRWARRGARMADTIGAASG